MPTKAEKKRTGEPMASSPKKISIRQTPEESAKSKSYFQQRIFENEFKESLKNQIADAKPYHWGTIKELVDDKLLRGVREEIMREIEFTKKETDIYKVFQSGDLANLSRLSEELRQRLPSLYKVRSALYSQEFRDLMSEVTGCGKLSGVKTDISIHLYNRTCHLLTHDDVIGSRRVSFILYMPDPDGTWGATDGGALRLFDSIVPNVPQSDPHSKLSPQFNQIAFFEVQPGKSFHDVEEVTATKNRLSLQGWFHIPQEGEDGFIAGEQEKTEARSTLQQLESKALKEYDFPKPELHLIPGTASDQFCLQLSADDKRFLMKYMNPYLLSQGAIEQLGDVFSSASVVDIMSFLNEEYAEILGHGIKHFELNEYPPMPSKQAEVTFPWKLAIPSHKQRYLYLDGASEQDISSAKTIKRVNETNPVEEPDFELTAKLLRVQHEAEDRAKMNEEADEDATTANEISAKLCDIAAMFKSIAFGKWVYQVTKLKALKDQILIRRFRPGHDFTLATKLDKDDDEEANEDDDSGPLSGALEATLNLTPTEGWETGEWGGYELCMVDEAEETAEQEKLNEDEAAIYRSSEGGDSIAYESHACWNKLCLMFRDPSVMKFVKYVSNDAPGSRWDITGTWKVEDEADDEEEEDEDEEEGDDA